MHVVKRGERDDDDDHYELGTFCGGRARELARAYPDSNHPLTKQRKKTRLGPEKVETGASSS